NPFHPAAVPRKKRLDDRPFLVAQFVTADFADSGQPFRKVADTRFGKSRTALGVKIEEPCFVQG
ncbi:hypothetical protein LCGC14_1762550, partial [marine sediment metagenome]